MILLPSSNSLTSTLLMVTLTVRPCKSSALRKLPLKTWLMFIRYLLSVVWFELVKLRRCLNRLRRPGLLHALRNVGLKLLGRTVGEFRHGLPDAEQQRLADLGI